MIPIVQLKKEERTKINIHNNTFLAIDINKSAISGLEGDGTRIPK